MNPLFAVVVVVAWVAPVAGLARGLWVEAERRRRLRSTSPAVRLGVLRALLVEEPDLYPVLAPRIEAALAARGGA